MINALTASDVTFGYGRRGFRIDVPTFVAAPGMNYLVGSNGSGKSTFIRLLGGLLPPQRGEVCYDGRSLASAETYRRYCRDSGYLWQNFQLRGSTSAVGYLEYRAWLHGFTPTQARSTAQHALARAGLSDMRERAVGRLSGGMQRRIGIAAETLHAPRVLLLDEPSSGLDLEARERAYDALDALLRDDAVVITVAHDPGEIARYAATVHVMAAGSVVGTHSFAAGEMTEASLRELLGFAAR